MVARLDFWSVSLAQKPKSAGGESVEMPLLSGERDGEMARENRCEDEQ